MLVYDRDNPDLQLVSDFELGQLQGVSNEARLLTRAGAHNARKQRQMAGNAVSYGLPQDPDMPRAYIKP